MSHRALARALLYGLLFAGGVANQAIAQGAAARYERPAGEVIELSALVGEWDLSVRQFNANKNTWVTVAADRSVIDTILDGRFVRQSITIRNGPRPLRTDFIWSFDRIQQRYRMVALDDFVGLVDSFEGRRDGARIVVDNTRANTFWAFPPREQDHVLAEVSLEPVGTDRIRMTQRITTDGGKTWSPLYEGEARRVPTP